MFFRPSRMEVHLDRIAGNYRALRDLAGPKSQIMAVIKADGYGLGMKAVAQALEEAGCRLFATATADEALALKEEGLSGGLLVLGPIVPQAADPLVRHGISVTVTDLELLPFLSAAARRFDRPARCHIKVDTGMGRIGFFPEELEKVLEAFFSFPGLALEGLFTHFATADEADRSHMDLQFRRYRALLDLLERRGLKALRHCCNSAALLRAPEMALDACRPGGALYGFYPANCPRTVALKPAFEVKTSVALVRELPAHFGISYGLQYRTNAPARIAVLPLGYADGLCRSMSGRFSVLIRGQRAPQVGALCMDQMMVDVTAVAGAQKGDEVVIVGTQGQETIAAEELAAARPGSIAYQVPLSFSKRIPRVYLPGPTGQKETAGS